MKTLRIKPYSPAEQTICADLAKEMSKRGLDNDMVCRLGVCFGHPEYNEYDLSDKDIDILKEILARKRG